MSTYSDGLRHGYDDAYEQVQDILGRDISDAKKLELIGYLVASRVTGAVTALPDEYPDEDAHDPRD